MRCSFHFPKLIALFIYSYSAIKSFYTRLYNSLYTFVQFVIHACIKKQKAHDGIIYIAWKKVYFSMNICSALTAYCFFENKPQALTVDVQESRQVDLFA